jgi:hypothetical protein
MKRKIVYRKASDHMCSYCHKEPADPLRMLCGRCDAIALRQRSRMCYKCGEREVIKGTLYCGTCSQP